MIQVIKSPSSMIHKRQKQPIRVKCAHYDFSVSSGSGSYRTHCMVVFSALLRWFDDILVLSYFKIDEEIGIFVKIIHK